MSKEPDVLFACANVATAAGEMSAAQDAEVSAADAARDAKRKLNRVQRDFDRMYAEMRRTAPPESHWGRSGDFSPPVWNETDY